MLKPRPWSRYALGLQLKITCTRTQRCLPTLPQRIPVQQRQRCFHNTAIKHDQHLQGYKDTDRYHGKYPNRTHMCGDLRPGDQDKQVVLCGWAQPSRSLSQDLVFLPIRDASGTTQLVYRAEHCPQHIKTTIQKLSTESVVCVQGVVRARPEGTVNAQLPTGGIEVEIQHIYCLNPASPHLPFWPSQAQLPNEEMRLKYRYLDLRRPTLQNNLRLRSLTANTIRQYLIDQHGFTEIETPTLFKSTPEGAREFVVPTRKPGLFYALPQSPQQHKQMLMAAGFDRYFQIARCFRDEDLRADRQPEFTQIDLEMSFVSVEQVQQVIEGMVAAIWSKALGIQLTKASFPHMTYHDAMSKYGSDKPDLRFDMQIQDMTRCLKKDNEAKLDCLVIKQGASQLTGGDLKTVIKELELTEAEQHDFGFVKVNENNLLQWQHKCGGGLRQGMDTLSPDEQQRMNRELNIEQGDIVFVHQRPDYLYGGNTLMGKTRLQLANHLQRKGHLTLDTAAYKFVWIESFPLFTPDEQGIRTWQATHHPFTAPFDQDIPLLGTDPAKVRGQHYDLVLNGMEIGGGSIRIHSPVMQTFIFDKVLQLEKHEYERFDHLVDALGGGCPPHGGIALGFDRLMAILCQSSSIRDVIAFPKAAGGKDFVVDSPSQVTPSQLKEYGLKVESS
ncbi:tRNA synthetases class II-domain-containing protein [Chlamydoabsidia padenii]|nr:tRNA synthetases class II-domain-containing protein [Chlamydoabsidia padenii]